MSASAALPSLLPVHEPVRAHTLVVSPEPVERLLIAHVGRDHHAVADALGARVVVGLGVTNPRVALLRTLLDQRVTPIEIELPQLVRRERIGGDARSDVLARERELPAQILRERWAVASEHRAPGAERQGDAGGERHGLEE